jgi:hypothetical protein
LAQEDTSKQAQKPKGRFPDMERTLSNWVKKLDQPVTDAMLQDKIMQFAASVELADDDIKQKVNNSSWLEKFKAKHGLLLSKARKNAQVEETDKSTTQESGPQSPTMSPTSPKNKRDASPSRLSIALDMGKDPTAGRKKLKSESPEFNTSDSTVQTPVSSISNHGHRPFASISGAFTTVLHTTYTAAPISPTSPRFFDPTNPFNPEQHGSIVQGLVVGGSGYSRPRSQTFPMTAPIESYLSPTSSEVSKFLPGTHDSPVDHLAVSIPSGSFLPELMSSTPENDSIMRKSSQDHQHPVVVTDVGSMVMPPPTSTTSTPMTPAHSQHHHMSPQTPHMIHQQHVAIAPGSPSIDETRRALEVVWTFFSQQHQHVGLEPDEYVVMNRLMEKLKLQRQGGMGHVQGHNHSFSHDGHGHLAGVGLPGGMHRLEDMGYAAVGKSISE